MCEICGDINTKTKTKNNKTGKILCNKCYQQLSKFGISKRTKYDKNEIIKHTDYAELKLYDRFGSYRDSAFLDICDIDKIKLYKWYLDSTGYVRSSISNSKIRLHNFILNNLDSDLVVDHIDSNKLNNRRYNIRICSQQENTVKKSKQCNNTSNIIGVSKDKSGWVAKIQIKNIQIKLSKTFGDKESAILQRLKWEIKYLKEFAPQMELIKEKYSYLLDPQ